MSEPAVMVANSSTLRKVLRMVQELHTIGYQRLRIAPGLSASGTSWRCSITPRSNILSSNGARLHDWTLAAHYTSSQGRRYFDWSDVALSRPIELAKAFVQRFPRIAEAGSGADWEYAGWYAWMMHLTYPDALPYAYADWDVPTDHLPASGTREVRIPLPPPGDAAGERLDP